MRAAIDNEEYRRAYEAWRSDPHRAALINEVGRIKEIAPYNAILNSNGVTPFYDEPWSTLIKNAEGNVRRYEEGAYPFLFKSPAE